MDKRRVTIKWTRGDRNLAVLVIFRWTQHCRDANESSKENMSGIYTARPAEPIICTLGNKGTIRCYSDHNGCSLLSQVRPLVPWPQREKSQLKAFTIWGMRLCPDVTKDRSAANVWWGDHPEKRPFQIHDEQPNRKKKDHFCFQKVIQAIRSNNGEVLAVNMSECRSGKLSLDRFFLHLSLRCLLPSPCTHNRLLCARPSECCEMAGQWDRCVVRTGGWWLRKGVEVRTEGGRRGGERKT